MTRREELLSLVKASDEKTRIEAAQLVEEIIFLEKQLKELKKQPFLSVSPKNPAHQKATPASRQYKEFLQQYNNSFKLFLHIVGDLGGEVEAESPLREWVRNRKEIRWN